jgi:integrase
MPSVWVFQELADGEKLGEDGATWHVGWYEPDGRRRRKSFGPGFKGKKAAERYRAKTEAELMTGTYATDIKKPWDDFIKEYARRVLEGLDCRTRDEALTALAHYQRLMKPAKLFAIGTGHIDEFTAKRRQEKGKKEGDLVSPATVNKDLRHLRAALGMAVEWGYLRQLPRFRMEKVPKKLATYVTGDHFAAIYAACDVASKPAGLPYPPGDWWRGLIVMAYMTGWRISELLALRRDDLDLVAGVAITRAEDNKGKRDEAVRLHPVIVEHLKKLAAFEPVVFPFKHYKTELYKQFAAIQEAAVVPDGKGGEVPLRVPCVKAHKHTRFCHVYGFHDFRRAFATMNADKLTPDALQSLMRHKSYSTTQIYINLARQMDDAVASLHVPEVLKKQPG